jgi:tRNA threonylcarbamoyladenosine biosynthesis protein TsaE
MKINLDQLPEFTKEFLKNITEKNWKAKSGATVVLLSGNLGAGKTTFTKALAEELNIEEEITSPTFVIRKRYELKKNDFKNLIHIDAYRLESGEEIQALEFEEDIKDKDNLVLIEWPEKIESAIETIPQENIITLSFEVVDDVTREILVITHAKEA